MGIFYVFVGKKYSAAELSGRADAVSQQQHRAVSFEVRHHQAAGEENGFGGGDPVLKPTDKPCPVHTTGMKHLRQPPGEE